MTEWFENEKYWRELYPYMFPTKRFEATEKEIQQRRRSSFTTPSTPVRNCGCCWIRPGSRR